MGSLLWFIIIMIVISKFANKMNRKNDKSRNNPNQRYSNQPSPPFDGQHGQMDFLEEQRGQQARVDQTQNANGIAMTQKKEKLSPEEIRRLKEQLRQRAHDRAVANDECHPYNHAGQSLDYLSNEGAGAQGYAAVSKYKPRTVAQMSSEGGQSAQGYSDKEYAARRETIRQEELLGTQRKQQKTLLRFSQNEAVNGIVWSEILKRPADKRRRV